MRRLFIIIALVLTALTAAAQRQALQETTRVLLILDCSQSMWDHWQSDSKIKIAQHVLLNFVDSLQNQPDMEIALRVFGHLNKDSYATRLEVPFGSDNLYQIKSKLKTLVPNGGTTVASALDNSPADFPHDDHARNIILIITDGTDNSDGNLCEVAQRVQQKGSVVQTFIIGIGSPDNFKQQPDCAGRFTLLTNEERFGETLREILFLSDQKALLTLSLVDGDNRPYETDVPITLFDHRTHTLKHSTLYHYTSDTPPDTLVVDPFINYDITIHTTPPIQLLDRHFKPGRHTPLPVSAPQSSLTLSHEKRRTAFQMPSYTVLVRRHSDPELLATQPLNATRHYLAGRYDIEVLSLPVIRLNNIVLRDGANISLQIPLPGQLALDKPATPSTGSIFVYHADGLQWVCDLDPAATTERITLMPGQYLLILRPLDNPSHQAVRSFHFSIQSAQQTGLKTEGNRKSR